MSSSISDRRADRPLAYVSDEDYVALDRVRFEIAQADGGIVGVLESTPGGAVLGNIPEGQYLVTLAKEGFVSKRVSCVLNGIEIPSFRILSRRLRGFMWPKWVKQGDKSEIKLHSSEQVQLTLWRCGLRKEFVRVLSWFDEHGPHAIEQITPDDDFTQTGVQWNRTGYPVPHVQQFIPAPERSGLYYLLARTASGAHYSFPWVVAPAKPRARIAVLANTNTWNAYNNFGGRSNYINPTKLPKRPTVNARQDLSRYIGVESTWKYADSEYGPLSFERPEDGNDLIANCAWEEILPTDSIAGRVQCGLAPGEWRLLAWMEQEGFAYDYYADAQLHDGSMSLDAYHVLMVGVHPEYWTREMFRRVEEWVHSGGQLMYLGGNGLNCEVTIEGDQMRCLSFDDTAQPESKHESRMHRTYAPEARLLGVAFTDSGVMTAAPYAVEDASHWVLEGTDLRRGESFGATSQHERVPGGASGHETDKVTARSPVTVERIAKGMNPNGGGAEMIHMRLGAGAVFSTGSITWVASLLVDPHVSRITANVLRRFSSPANDLVTNVANVQGHTQPL
jgi:N,N-dimethylformamidase